MPRIATIDSKEDLASEHRPIFEEIARSRGRVGGPFVALLHSPELAKRTAHLGSYVRFESSVDHKTIELAALAAARELECKHEWAAHVGHAQKAGIPIGTIRAIQHGNPIESYSVEDAEIISYVQELLRHRKVSEPTFQALYARLGERGLVELTATIGYYAMLACTMNAFDVQTTETPPGFEI